MIKLFINMLLGELRFNLSKKSYSQSGEDLLLFSLAKDNKITYIDIGSGHPIRFSNTYFFYKKGFRGILVDPLYYNFLINKLLRPKDKFYRRIVGNSDNIVYQFYPSEYSTTKLKRYEEIVDKDYVTFLGKKQIETINVNELFLGIDLDSTIILSIDVEGMDFSILNEIDFNKNRPQLICVEDWEFKLNLNFSNIYKLLIKNNYEFVGKTLTNCIYIDKFFKNH